MNLEQYVRTHEQTDVTQFLRSTCIKQLPEHDLNFNVR